jgi:probable HAF family extracellular repeat protein
VISADSVALLQFRPYARVRLALAMSPSGGIILLKCLCASVVLLVVMLCIGVSGALAAPPPGWGSIDLGTLGGTQSHAWAVNTAGEVVGDSSTPGDGATHAFSWTAAGGMHDLGTLGGTFSSAVAINTSGQIAGYATDGSENMFAVRWSAAGAIQKLGGTASSAVAINDAGTVVGVTTLPGGVQHAFRFSGAIGPMVDLGTLGGTMSIPIGINAAGQIAGYSTLAGDTEQHAVVWSGIQRIDIGTMGYFSQATAINDAGQVVGFRAPNNGPDAQTGFLWTSGAALLPIGGASTRTTANAINAAGQIVGAAPSAADPSVMHAFSWTAAGVPTDIGVLPGGSYAAGNAVSVTGEVVGTSQLADDSANHAFFWTSTGAMLDLGTLGGNDSNGVAVNRNAQVVAYSSTASGDIHAAVWQRDTTPPVITAQVSGTLGQNGWYTGNVTVGWTTTDSLTPITSQPCAGGSVTIDTVGTTFTCSATSGGGTATKSVTIKRDATPPVVAFAAHPDSYSADQTITIACSASDATSGLAATCQGVDVAGSLLPLGSNTRTTTATDKAGDTRTASTTFTVTAGLPNKPTPSSVCLLMQKDVQGSAKYAALSPFNRFYVDIVTTLACSWVKAIAPSMSPTQKASLLASFKSSVTSLLAGGWITADQATTLRAQVDQL